MCIDIEILDDENEEQQEILALMAKEDEVGNVRAT